MTEWLSSSEVAARAARHVVTVRLAAETGELHGHQRTRGGRWRFTAGAVEAWMFGRDSAAACGCRALRPVSSARRSA